MFVLNRVKDGENGQEKMGYMETNKRQFLELPQPKAGSCPFTVGLIFLRPMMNMACLLNKTYVNRVILGGKTYL